MQEEYKKVLDNNKVLFSGYSGWLQNRGIKKPAIYQYIKYAIKYIIHYNEDMKGVYTAGERELDQYIDKRYENCKDVTKRYIKRSIVYFYMYLTDIGEIEVTTFKHKKHDPTNGIFNDLTEEQENIVNNYMKDLQIKGKLC